jgi:hypothetical protein
MIHFFENQSNAIFAVQTQGEISAQDISKLNWLLPTKIKKSVLTDFLLVPRRNGNPGVPMPLKSPKIWQFQESSELRSFIMLQLILKILIPCFRKNS